MNEGNINFYYNISSNKVVLLLLISQILLFNSLQGKDQADK